MTHYLFIFFASLFLLITSRDILRSLREVFQKKYISSPISYILTIAVVGMASVEYIDIFSGTSLKNSISKLFSVNIVESFQILFILIFLLWALVNSFSIKSIFKAQINGPFYSLLFIKKLTFEQIPAILLISTIALSAITALKPSVLNINFDIESNNAQKFYSSDSKPKNFSYILNFFNSEKKTLDLKVETIYSYNNSDIFKNTFHQNTFSRTFTKDCESQTFSITIPPTSTSTINLLSTFSTIPNFISKPVNIKHIFNSPWEDHDPVKINRYSSDSEHLRPDKLSISNKAKKIGEYTVQNPLSTNIKDFINIKGISDQKINETSVEFTIFWQSLITIRERSHDGMLNQYIVNGCIKHKPSMIYNRNDDSDIILTTGVFSESIELNKSFLEFTNGELRPKKLKTKHLNFLAQPVAFPPKDYFNIKIIQTNIGESYSNKKDQLGNSNPYSPINSYECLYIIDDTNFYPKQLDLYRKKKNTAMHF